MPLVLAVSPITPVFAPVVFVASPVKPNSRRSARGPGQSAGIDRAARRDIAAAIDRKLFRAIILQADNLAPGRIIENSRYSRRAVDITAEADRTAASRRGNTAHTRSRRAARRSPQAIGKASSRTRGADESHSSRTSCDTLDTVGRPTGRGRRTLDAQGRCGGNNSSARTALHDSHNLIYCRSHEVGGPGHGSAFAHSASCRQIICCCIWRRGRTAAARSGRPRC